ncbi:hypothetical protein R5R35_006620 [Gryllus longicercus]|uniref:BTB domain-containing protein n=1 Tax=Gryllus longicercus TaxID=2509291 RepID=A0AAN9VT09_9ORTH
MHSEQQFCLRWNDHQSTLVAIFEALLDSNTLVDCTLAAEGQCLRAHKVVLSACSPYFQLLLSQHTDKHPIVILKDVKFEELKAMVEYMYRGEVNIPQDQLGPLLKAAESLQIRGLGGASNKETSGKSDKSVPFHKEGEKKRLPPQSGSISPPPRPLSSGAVGDQPRSNQTAATRRGSVSPTPRKRSRPLRTTDGTDAHSSSEPCDPSSQSHPSLVPDTSSIPNLPSLSALNQSTVSASNSDWTDMNTGKASSLPTSSSVESIPPLAPLSSSFSDSVGESSGNRKWPEIRLKGTSSPAHTNPLSEAAAGDSQKLLPVSEILLVPKTEYVEVEDDSLPQAMLEDVHDMDVSGPSHADGSGGSAAFVPWLENLEGMVDEASGQDMAAAYRASQVYETVDIMPHTATSRSRMGKVARGILSSESASGSRRGRKLSCLRRRRKETMTEEEREQLRTYERERKRVQRAKKAARVQATQSSSALWGTSFSWS